MAKKQVETSGLVNWAVSTAVASIILLSYVHSFVYTRTEANNLEKKVDKNGDKLDSLILHLMGDKQS